MRDNQRQDDELRPYSVARDIQPDAAGSVLIKMGNTQVICAVTVEEAVPPFLKGTGRGWITAEYGMLPCAANSRVPREAVRGRQGRTYEIQRLIGRALRMMMDLSLLGERTLRVDCDVIRADGGTRTAAINGAALAIRDVVHDLYGRGALDSPPRLLPIAAISVGLVDGRPLLDLDYREDAAAAADANFVMTGEGGWVEVQCTAEGRALAQDEFAAMTRLARQGLGQLLQCWWATP